MSNLKNSAIVSAMTGFFFGLITYFLLQYLEIDSALFFSVFAGLFFYLLLLLFMLIYGKVMEKRYAAIEKEITSPIFYKTNGNFNLGNGKLKNGNIYFCEAGIVCVCLEEKPYTLDEILIQNIDRYTYTNTQLNIFTNDDRLFVITSIDTQKITNVLAEKGWIMPEEYM